MSYGALFANLTKDQKQEVIKRVSKESAKRFKAYMEALRGTMDFKKPTTEDRLAFYRTRMPQVWALLQMQRPDLYKQQMEDWVKMELRRAQFQLSPWNPFAPNSDSPADFPGPEI